MNPGFHKHAPRLLSFAALSAGLLACGTVTGPKDHPEASQLTAINSAFDPRVGEAYSQTTDQYLAQSCISYDPNNLEYIPPQFGELAVTRNASFNQLTDAFGGGGEVNLNLSAFQANGALQFANEMQSGTYSTTYMIALNMKGGELALPQQFAPGQARPTLNENGTKAKALSDVEKLNRCGSRFVSRKNLSANVVAVLKFEFANKGQKDSFSGKIALKIPGLGLEGKADLAAALNQSSEDANITLKVVQMGGDASQLSKALSSKITRCNSQDRESCHEAIDILTSYVRDEFPKQFVNSATGKVDPNRFVATNYEYAAYESIDANFTPPAIAPEKAKALQIARRLVGERMLDEEANYFRASALVRSGLKISPQQLEEIRGIQTKIVNRLKVYSDGAQICYSENWASCDKALDAIEAKLKARPDLYDFDITKLVVIPTDIGGWCAKIKQWNTVMKDAAGGEAVGATILSDDELFSLSHLSRKILSAGPTPLEIQFNVKSSPGANQVAIDALSCWDMKQYIRSDKLDIVDLSATRLSNVDPIASLYYTPTLNLSKNFVEDATALSKIRYLKSLDLSQNRVTTLAGIKATNIENLNLTNNGLKKGDRASADSIFREISGSETLKVLTLNSNDALRSLASLSSLPALDALYLLDTAIDQTELLALQARRAKDFPALTKIFVRSAKVGTATKSCPVFVSEVQGLTCQ